MPAKKTSKKNEKKPEGEPNLSESLGKLEAIAEWFDEQEEVDIEEGLAKVKEAAELIKDSRGRLAEIENEFLEIRKEVEEG